MEKTQINLGDLPAEKVLAEKQGRMDKISFYLIILAVFLCPLLFTPFSYAPLQFGKTILLAIAAIGSFILWIIGRLKDGKFNIPSNLIILGAALVVLVSALSTIFSESVGNSFMGQGYESGTFASIVVFMLFVFLIPIIFRTKDKILYLYLTFFTSFFIVAIFHLLRILFGPGFLSFGLFTDPTSNFIGKWSDLGIFFGLSAILSLVTVELISLSKLFKIFVYLTLIVSIFFLMIVNFFTTWVMIGIFSLIIFVYNFAFSKDSSKAVAVSLNGETSPSGMPPIKRTGKIAPASLTVLIISVVFILAGTSLGNYISSKLNIAQLDARPNWSATLNIAGNTLSHHPVLGIGPNRFVSQWLLYKPAGINNTVFWNTDFNNGVGFVPTFIVTEGILGILVWLFFLGSFLYIGFKAILAPINDKISRFLILSSFMAALFLWIINIFYMPSTVIIALTFIFTGLFIAAASQEKIIKIKMISFANDSKLSFISVLVLIIFLLSSLALGYIFIKKFGSAVYFSSATNAFNVEGNSTKAEQYIGKAAGLYGSDIYLRSLVETGLVKMNAVLSQDATKVSADSIRSGFQSVFGEALSNAKAAVDFNNSDYQNWVSLGRVYEAVVPLKIQGAYENAVSSYLQAVKLNPSSPALYLTLARLEMSNGNNAKAKEYITQAVALKNNYTDAIFFLSQIEAGEGDLKAAIASAEAASAIAPNDPSVFFQLGLLRYNAKDYAGSAAALERAVALNTSYANAKYFLGLSYANIGKSAEAIQQFTDLKASNPDNKEVATILANLKAGKAPFTGITPPADSKPEKRATPPIKETKAKPTLDQTTD
ncbi:MAG: tetratricopeptide repeat protein [Candidatus Paceibacterota bacterium]